MMKFPAKKRACRLAAVLLTLALLAGCGGQPPQAVGNVVAERQKDTVTLTWQAVEDATGYRILRKKGGDADARFLCDIQQTTFTDCELGEGCTYIYTVKALNDSGISEGTRSNAVSTPAAVPQAVQISSVTAMDRYTTVLLLSEAGTPCEVLRSRTAEGEYLPIGTAENGVFYDTDTDQATTYYYRAKRTGEEDIMLSEPAQTGTNAGEVFCLPVLMYHDFVTQQDLKDGILLDEYAIYAEEFEQDLRWLAENGYQTVTAAQLVGYLRGNGSLPEKPVMISIDDGKYGVYRRAWPLLQQYGMQAVLSVIGNEIDAATAAPEGRETAEAPYCTWDELGEMAASGAVEMISHTAEMHRYNHNGRQGACNAPEETAEEFLPLAKKDYATISAKIKKATGEKPIAMAYPYSKRTAESDAAWLAGGYQLLLGGNSADVRQAQQNYFVREAGLNPDSAILRRLARMRGTGIGQYITDAIRHDS